MASGTFKGGQKIFFSNGSKNTNLRPSVAVMGDHCYGRGDYSTVLWNILMYQAWHENYKTRS